MESKTRGTTRTARQRRGTGVDRPRHEARLGFLEFLDGVVDNAGKTRRLAVLLLVVGAAIASLCWLVPGAHWLWAVFGVLGVNGVARTRQRLDSGDQQP